MSAQNVPQWAWAVAILALSGLCTVVGWFLAENLGSSRDNVAKISANQNSIISNQAVITNNITTLQSNQAVVREDIASLRQTDQRFELKLLEATRDRFTGDQGRRLNESVRDNERAIEQINLILTSDLKVLVKKVEAIEKNTISVERREKIESGVAAAARNSAATLKLLERLAGDRK